MTLSPSFPRRSLASTSTVAGVAALVLAIYLVAVTPPADGKQTFDSVEEFAREGIVLVWLASSIAAVRSARSAGLAPKVASGMISVGYGLIFVGVAIGVALREDPDWFLALGAPGQLLSMAGFVIWAIRAKQHETFGLPLVLLCGVGGLTAILGAEVGLTVLIAAFWFGLARTAARPSAAAAVAGTHSRVPGVDGRGRGSRVDPKR
jgi:hypothetical protein